MKKAFLIIGIIIAMTGCGIVDTQQAKTEDTSNYDTLSVFNYNIETESLDSIGYLVIIPSPFCDTVKHDTIIKCFGLREESMCISSIKCRAEVRLHSDKLRNIVNRYESLPYTEMIKLQSGICLYAGYNKSSVECLEYSHAIVGGMDFDHFRTCFTYQIAEKDMWGNSTKNYKIESYVFNNMIIDKWSFDK